MDRSPMQRDAVQTKHRDGEQRRHKDREQRRHQDDEKRPHRDDEKRPHRDDEKRKHCDNDEKRRGDGDNDWRSRDPEGKIRRDEERKCRRYDERKKHGGGDSTRRGGGGDHQKRPRECDLRRKIEEKQRRRGSGEREQKPARKENTPPLSDSVDIMQEMFKSFPPSSPSTSNCPPSTSNCPPSTSNCTRGKNEDSDKGRTWGDTMEAEMKPKAGNENKENTHINPWKRSASRERETDEKKLGIRKRQIDIGKASEGYQKYTNEIQRKDRTHLHPQTPDRFTLCSTRSWQGVVRIWRRKLHFWDPPDVAKEHQKKFANILPTPFDEDEEGDDEDDDDKVEEDKETEEDCELNDCIENEDDCIENEDFLLEDTTTITTTATTILEDSSQSSSISDSLHCGEDITESMLFWNNVD